MNVYDPVGQCWREPREVVTLGEVDGLTVVRPIGARYWFGLRAWTNESVAEGFVAPELRQRMAELFLGAVLAEDVSRRCSELRSLQQVPPMESVEADAMLTEALGEMVEQVGLLFAVESAQSRGYSSSEIAFALRTLQAAPTLTEILQGIEVVSVRDLAARVRTREPRTPSSVRVEVVS